VKLDEFEQHQSRVYPAKVSSIININGSQIRMSGSWFPTIFSDKCDGCMKTGKPRCVEFCPNGVFIFKTGISVVANPANCGKDCSIPNCSACAPLCHNKAISFPSETAIHTQDVKDKKALLRKTTCEVCGKLYWTDRETDVCFDCEK